ISGNAGSVLISSGGDLTINLSPITINHLGLNGNGANYTFIAGNAGAGNLLVLGNLNASGIGTGSGGSVTVESSSPTVMNLGSLLLTNTNGLRGTVSLLGGKGKPAGNFTAINNGGSVLNTLKLTTVNNVTLTAGAAGSASSVSLGSKTTSSISLNA